MTKRYLEPIAYSDRQHAELARALIKVLSDELFTPIAKIIDEEKDADSDDKPRRNAKPSALLSAIEKGTIRFQHGRFVGTLTAQISREIKELGGEYKRGYWRIVSPRLPTDIQLAIMRHEDYVKRLGKSLASKFDGVVEKIIDKVDNLDIESMGVEGLNPVSVKFKKQLNKAISVYPDIGEKGKLSFAKEYFDTEEKPIKKEIARRGAKRIKDKMRDFAPDVVKRLRTDLEESVMNGRPRAEIRQIVSDRLGIEDWRCKFIARQETALMTVEFNRQQYIQAGIDKYVWVTVGDHVVRDTPEGGHKALAGNVYSWENGPEAKYFSCNESCHPGQDYNCRCQAKPIVEW